MSGWPKTLFVYTPKFGPIRGPLTASETYPAGDIGDVQLYVHKAFAQTTDPNDPSPSDTEGELETWTECEDCGFNLGAGHLANPPVSEMLPVGDECPKCGERMREVVALADIRAALAAEDKS